jgi:hypothetical protein
MLLRPPSWAKSAYGLTMPMIRAKRNAAGLETVVSISAFEWQNLFAHSDRGDKRARRRPGGGLPFCLTRTFAPV